MVCVLIILNFLAEPSDLRLCFLSLFLSLDVEFRVLHLLICHDLCYFCLDLNLPSFLLSNLPIFDLRVVNSSVEHLVDELLGFFILNFWVQSRKRSLDTLMPSFLLPLPLILSKLLINSILLLSLELTHLLLINVPFLTTTTLPHHRISIIPSTTTTHRAHPLTYLVPIP